mmetsp:Transcript_67855/g.187703  ORF Transcript_67855/g.187703 Transcript_67855/m.187703 type:complete len:245 (+) Transcript_67855:100-834(+)
MLMGPAFLAVSRQPMVWPTNGAIISHIRPIDGRFADGQARERPCRSVTPAFRRRRPDQHRHHPRLVPPPTAYKAVTRRLLPHRRLFPAGLREISLQGASEERRRRARRRAPDWPADSAARSRQRAPRLSSRSKVAPAPPCLPSLGPLPRPLRTMTRPRVVGEAWACVRIEYGLTWRFEAPFRSTSTPPRPACAMTQLRLPGGGEAVVTRALEAQWAARAAVGRVVVARNSSASGGSEARRRPKQ